MQLNQNVVKFEVELVALFQKHHQLVLNHDSLVDFLEVSRFCRVVTNRSQKVVQFARVRLDNLRNFLLFLLSLLVFLKEVGVLLPVFLKNLTLLSRASIYFHQVIDSVDSVVHCLTFSHGLLLFQLDCIELLQSLLDGKNGRILSDCSSCAALRNLTGNVGSSFGKKGETFGTRVKLLLNVHISCLGHLELRSVVSDLLLVLAVHA